MNDIRHFINILDYSRSELEYILARADSLKQRMKQGIVETSMAGKVLAMFFEKPSTRTRISLESAIATMGGTALNLEGNEGKGARLGDRESLEDVARVVSRYVDVMSIRTFEHSKVEVLAQYSTVPVINALSDWSHPTQAMADIMTMREHFGDTDGRHLVFVGDGNNVARSLAALCARLSIRFTLACPQGYELTDDFLAILKKKAPDANISQINDPHKAVADASVVYTDVWASMGQEEEAGKRKAAFASFQVNEDLMRSSPSDAIVLHCLPAHRGEEISGEVMESKAAKVFDQAENRMHINRALFSALVAERMPCDAKGS